MLLTILAVVVALVAWSLHLMQEAMDRREFSLMLAGTLVAMAATALVGVYFLMGNYVGYVTRTVPYTLSSHQASESVLWFVQLDDVTESINNLSETSNLGLQKRNAL